MYNIRELISDIWIYVRPYKKVFWLSTFLQFVSNLSGLYPPYAFAIIVSFFAHYQPGMSLAPIYTAFILTTLAIAIRYVVMYFAMAQMFRVAEKIRMDVEQKAIHHLMLLDMSWHEQENAGSKFKRIERGATDVGRILKIWIKSVIEVIVSLVGVTLIMLKIDFGMGVAMIVFSVTYYYLAHFYRKRAVQAANIVNEKEEYRSGILFEAINNIRSVKVMSMSTKIMETFAANAKDMMVTIRKRIFWFQAGNSIRNAYAHFFRIGAMAFIVYGIVQGHYEIGFLVLFTGYFASVWQSIGLLTDVSEDFTIAKNSVFRMENILKTPITIDDEKGKIKFPANWKALSLKNISFSYQDKKVLDNISFEVKRGEKIGIIGLSGAGKSTLFKLLLKEHESYSGEIVFDGAPLKNISKQDYFNHLAVVLQDTELFNTSLRANITITNRKMEKNKQLLAEAIEIAHVEDFMDKLPKGLNSVIGEKGTRLSGGEKQRVGIARAIFKRPQILLLDEATAHLDMESEEKIQDSLHKFFQNITAIVIAHRLSTIKEMDRIIVIENGRIIESGSFAELYGVKGRFFELWEKQKLS